MNRKFLKILLFMILFSAVTFGIGKGKNMFSTDFSYKRSNADLKNKISSEKASNFLK